MKNLPARLALLLVIFSACAQKEPQPKAAPVDSLSTPTSAGLEVAARLGPGLEFPHLSVADPLGNRYDLYNLLTKPKNVVLLLDAFCPACGEEAETFQSLIPSGSDLDIVGVSKDSLPAVIAFKKRHHLLFPILLDVEQKLVPDYRRVTFPTLVVVGPGRKILQLREGPLARLEVQTLLQMLLN